MSFSAFWIILLTNNDRIRAGLPRLHESAELDAAAQAHADDLAKFGYFAHTTPDGGAVWTYVINPGYDYQAAGENLAENFAEPLSEEWAWMKSPDHRANILQQHFRDIGVGIKGRYVVVMFGEKQ